MAKIKNKIIFGIQNPSDGVCSTRDKFLLQFLQAYYDIKVIELNLTAKHIFNFWGSRFFQIRTYRKEFLKLLKIFDPELIHLCSPLQVGCAGYEIATAFDIPYIYEVRQLSGSEHVKNQKSRKLNKAQEQETTIIYYSEQVVTISEKIRQKIIERGIEPQKITVIPNGVDTLKIPSQLNQSKNPNLFQKYHLQNKKVVGLLYNPALDDEKALIIRLIPEIIQRIPNVTFFLIGNNLDNPGSTDFVQQMNLSKYIITIQKIDSLQSHDLFSLLDLVIFPDIFTQSILQDVVLEVMMLGKSILAANNGEMIDLIQNGVTGFLFQVDDFDNLITKCLTLLQRDTLRHKIGQAARNWVQQNRRWNVVLEKYRDIYERILAK